VAQRGGIRPGTSRPGSLARIRTGGRSAEGSRGVERPGDPETRTVQGRASIEVLGRARGPESPRIGYAPLVNRTKQWATESQIEGWFPPSSGERQSWKVTRMTGAEATPPHHPSGSTRRLGSTETGDAGGHTVCRQRVGDVRVDSLPHRRLRTLAVTPFAVSAWVTCVLTACPIEGDQWRRVSEETLPSPPPPGSSEPAGSPGPSRGSRCCRPLLGR
jgi:hypothetical protein